MPNQDLHPDFPEEYQVGSVVFFGRTIRVTPDVLIPRLETEVLIKRARKILKASASTTVVDIGSGSGIIGISCADLAETCIFLDISPEALRIAEDNYQTYFKRNQADFIVSDLLQNLPILATESVLLLANLPYIKAGDWGYMSADTHFEPGLALFGGEKTGFEMYERLFEQIETRFGASSQNIILMIEFGFDQRQIAEEILQKYEWKYEFFADYGGIERFCEIVIR